MGLMGSAQAAPPLPAGWLRETSLAPAFDLALIFGVAAVAFTMGLACAWRPALFLPLVTVHSWLFGFDHVVATFTKLAGLPEDRRRYRALIWHLPPLLLLATLALGQLQGIRALTCVYFLWQAFHMTRQSWGIAQHYRRRAGGLAWDPPALAEATLWCVPLWGILHRCHQQPAHFLYLDLWLPAVPRWLVQGTGLASAALLGLWLVMRVRAHRRGQLALGHTLYLVSHFAVFFTGSLVIEDFHAGWLLVNVWHNVQYLVYVWQHNRERFSSGVREDARLLSWLCQPGWPRAVGYFLACLVVSTPIYLLIYQVGDRIDALLSGRLISLALVVSLTLNFHHYLVDGVIWRRRPA